MPRPSKPANLNKAHAHDLLARGEVLSCEAVPAVMKHGWNMLIRFADGHTQLLQDQKRQDKWFGKPSTLIDVAKDIGFKAINIHLTGNNG